jgi:hypothetical protein
MATQAADAFAPPPKDLRVIIDTDPVALLPSQASSASARRGPAPSVERSDRFTCCRAWMMRLRLSWLSHPACRSRLVPLPGSGSRGSCLTTPEDPGPLLASSGLGQRIAQSESMRYAQFIYPCHPVPFFGIARPSQTLAPRRRASPSCTATATASRRSASTPTSVSAWRAPTPPSRSTSASRLAPARPAAPALRTLPARARLQES